MTAVVSSADILDLTGVSVRADEFTWDLLDAAHNQIGSLDVNLDTPPRIRNDTSRSAFRTCSSLAVSAADLSEINQRRDRVRANVTLQNGASFPLGIFMFGADARVPFSWGTTWTPELFDESFIVDQPLDQAYGVAPGDSILALVNLLVAQCNLPDVDFSMVADAPASGTISQKAGDSRRTLVSNLIQALGYYPPYFANGGTYTSSRAPVAGQAPDLTYASGGRIIDGSITTTNSGYRAPNRYQVVASSGSTAVVGQWDIPDDAPNSYANTGVLVVVTIPISGIPDVATANEIARLESLIDRNAYTQVSWSSTCDPRHDTFDLVSVLGVPYVESSWEIECRSGGLMSHSGIGFYG